MSDNHEHQVPARPTITISYDAHMDELTIEGVKYAAVLFRRLAVLEPGQWFRLERRAHGALTIYQPPPGAHVVTEAEFDTGARAADLAALERDARLWRELQAAVNAEPCDWPCLRDDVGDWFRSHTGCRCVAGLSVYCPVHGKLAGSRPCGSSASGGQS